MPGIRPARAGEAEALTALCVRSKAHWGYDAAFMRLCVPPLTMSEHSIAEDRVPVASGGVGRLLFEAAVGLARQLGCRRMTILADVNAAPFHGRRGARYLRNEPSDAIPGRVLPFYEYGLTPGVQP
jgi:hypothetical protein